jgi:hypothetical protein
MITSQKQLNILHMKTSVVIILGVCIFVVLSWLLLSSGIMHPKEAEKTFQIPHGGEIVLPGRFVMDPPAPKNEVRSAFVPNDFLLLYGKRRWNIGGYQKISEAMAIGHQAVFPDWNEFRKRAAHFLQDADWRHEAMKEELVWRKVKSGDLDLQVASIIDIPGYEVLVAYHDIVPLWVVGFVNEKTKDKSLEAIKEAFNHYREPEVNGSETSDSSILQSSNAENTTLGQIGSNKDFRFSYPLNMIEFGQDAEDEPGRRGIRDFYGNMESLMLRFGDVFLDSNGQYIAGYLEVSWPETSMKSIELEAADQVWQVHDTWSLPDQSLLMLHRKDSSGKSLEFRKTSAFQKIMVIPIHSWSGTSDWPFSTSPVAIENERLYFRNGVPSVLREFFPEHHAIADNVVWWKEYAHPAEREAIENWRFHLESLLMTLETASEQTASRSAIGRVRELLSSTIIDLPGVHSITGRWEVHVLKGNAQEASMAGPTKAFISTTNKPQELIFNHHETRIGKLLPAQSKKILVFLGSKKSGNELFNGYSTLEDTIDASRRDSDTGGILLFVGKNHAVVLLDISLNAWEIYDMHYLGGME